MRMQIIQRVLPMPNGTYFFPVTIKTSGTEVEVAFVSHDSSNNARIPTKQRTSRKIKYKVAIVTASSQMSTVRMSECGAERLSG